jgi:type II secretory pathway pseudopilin PulG
MSSPGSVPDRLDELFGALAGEPVPVPAASGVVARGRQRRRKARAVAALAALAVIAACASGAAYAHQATSHARPAPATGQRTSKPGPVRRATLPPAGQGPLVLGLTQSSQLLMARIGSTAPPVTLPGVRNVTAVATDPGGGWVIAYAAGSQNGAPERLATVAVSGRVQQFGAELSTGWTVTGLAARPAGAGIAVALWHFTDNRLPGQIRLVPLPGHPGSTRTWTLSSALMTQAQGLSWRDATHLTYIPGSDETGGGFAPAGAVTLDTARPGSLAPAISSWPPVTKIAGQCHLLSGTWLPNGSGYLALQSCNSDTRLGLVSVTTGAAAGPTVVVPGFGCPAGQPLVPEAGGSDVLISFCGVSLESGGHVSSVPGIASDAAWAG